MAYNYKDIKEAYKKVGVKKGDVVLLKTDLRYLGKFDHIDQKEMLPAHFNAISDLIDLNEGTLIVSTATPSLFNTDLPFDVNSTPSEMGVLTEYVRKQKDSVRSFHPFDSWAALGKHANYICRNVSRHAYGYETPKDRMLKLHTMYLNIGPEPRRTSSIVHHAELLMGVPYRYVKEFNHPVVRNGSLFYEHFYCYVWYRECNLVRDKNKKIFKRFLKEGYTINKERLGKSHVYYASMNEIFNSAIKAMKEDIYIWLKEPPQVRPYQS